MDSNMTAGISIKQSKTEITNKTGWNILIYPIETVSRVKTAVNIKKIPFKSYKIPSGICLLID